MRFIAAICALVFTACGYKPLSVYSKNSLGEKIYVDLIIDPGNAENSIELKDLLNKSILTRFQKNISIKEDADTIILARISSINESPIATNDDGFSSFYRISVGINFTYKSKDGIARVFNNSAYVDYSVNIKEPLLTYQNRLSAINQAMLQAMDKFLAQISFQDSKS